MKKIISALLALIMIFLVAACGKSSQPEAGEKISNIADLFSESTTKLNFNERGIQQRDYYVDGKNAETVTVLIYMCGSDLESEFGAATADINEILYGDIGENVNIIMETGGTNQWKNDVIAIENQRYQLTNDGIVLLDNSLGNRDMTSPETLANFINYGVDNYPADRYMLILWDHGGGTIGGFGYDERFPDSLAMSLAEIDYALSTSKVYFDFIGFDACLMSTLEVAFVLEQYADYMIASQMTEPSGGWYYTNWISIITAQPSISIPKLSKKIIDDYLKNLSSTNNSVPATLSVVDLTRLYSVVDALSVFVESAQSELVNNGFAEISQARSGTRAIDQDQDHVDIIALAEKLNSYKGADDLIKAVKNCVVYESSSRVVSNRNGMNLYFPYANIDLFKEIIPVYKDIGFNSKYVEFMASFVSIMAGGQNIGASGGLGFGSGSNFSGYEDSTNIYDTLSEFSWFDESLYSHYNEGYYNDYSYNSEELEILDKDGQWVLSLNDEFWDIITDIEMTVLYDNGEGYINLGADNFYDFDEDGDLIIAFDNTWVSLDGQTVSFYYEDENYYDDGWSVYGYVPAYINGKYAEIVIKWDSESPVGYVLGYRVVYDSMISQKGLFQLKYGDTIEYVCNYYDYDLNYKGWSYLGKTTYYDGDLEVSYADIGYGDCQVYYCLTDIYGNMYFTESVIFYD